MQVIVSTVQKTQTVSIKNWVMHQAPYGSVVFCSRQYTTVGPWVTVSRRSLTMRFFSRAKRGSQDKSSELPRLNRVQPLMASAMIVITTKTHISTCTAVSDGRMDLKRQRPWFKESEVMLAFWLGGGHAQTALHSMKQVKARVKRIWTTTSAFKTTSGVWRRQMIACVALARLLSPEEMQTGEWFEWRWGLKSFKEAYLP